MNSRDGDKKQLPVVLPPVADELLSSWIARHGAFYNVSPRAMLRHAVPSARSLRAADDHLTDEQERLLAHIFRRELSGIRRMTFVNIQSSARRLIVAEAIQTCQTCAVDKADVGATAPILRRWRQAWRITCPICGSRLCAIGQGSAADNGRWSKFSRLMGGRPRGPAPTRRLRRAGHSDLGVPSRLAQARVDPT